MENSSIFEKIEAKGESDAQKILADARLEAIERENQILAEMEERTSRLLKQQEVKLADELKSAQTKCSQDEKSALLKAKKQLIEQVKEETLLKLCKMNDEDFKNYLIHQIKQNSLKGNEVLSTNEKTYAQIVKIFGKDLKELNALFNTHLTLSTDFINIFGGFILVGEAFDIDCSFETVVKDEASLLEQEIAKIIFAEA